MTRIDFYANVESRERTACTIAAKALERGVRLLVLTTDEAQSDRLDRLMWTFAQLSFLPHVRAAHPLAAQTPVIVDHAFDPLPSTRRPPPGAVNLCPSTCAPQTAARCLVPSTRCPPPPAWCRP